MSIERNGGPGAQKATASAEGHGVKGKARMTTGDSGGLAMGGFLALMSALGADGSAGMSGGVGLMQDGATDQQASGEGKLPPADLLPPDPAMLLAQSLQAAGSVATAQPGEAATAKSTDAAAVVESGTANGGHARGRPAPGISSAAEVKDARGETTVSLLATQSQDSKQVADELAAKAIKTFSDSMARTKSGDARSGAAVTPDWHALKPTYSADVASLSSSVAATMVAIGDAGAKQTERVAGKSEVRQIGGSAEGAWGHQALLAGGQVDAPSPTAEPSMVTPEMSVAEQVNYWISRDVQNAELKLDGFGSDPVEVSISMQGNEAHVSFRTDQAETREMLEGAVSHLKDLLKSEGLVLSGVSVGTSGHDGQGASERRNRPGARQATVMASEPAPVDGLSRAARPSGKSVDLFV